MSGRSRAYVTRSRRSSVHAVSALCIAVCAFALARCDHATGNVYVCAYENDRVLRGKCPTVCSTACRVAEIEDCLPVACRERCEIGYRQLSTGCQSALHSLWRCIADGPYQRAQCVPDGLPTIPFSNGECVDARAAHAAACPDPFPWPPPPSDAGGLDAESFDAADGTRAVMDGAPAVD